MTLVLIPARMASSRFPGKPLKKILGIPMIEHVYRRVKFCQNLDDVVVATCDQEIFDTVKKFGGKVIMTSSKHLSSEPICMGSLQISFEMTSESITPINSLTSTSWENFTFIP